MAKANPTLKALQGATKGLLFPSETDAGFEAFAWPGGTSPVTEAVVRSHAGATAKTPIEEVTVAHFFRAVPTGLRAAYFDLLVAIADHLSGVKVFKVGEVNMDVYVVGRTDAGNYAGVKTRVVET